MLNAQPTLKAITDLITSYHELNQTTIDEFGEEPSPLEFMRHVHRNRPFVVRNGAVGWSALQWNASYLQEAMAGQTVNISMTPNGNADSVLNTENDEAVFVKPYEVDMDFKNALEQIASQGREGGLHDPVCYAQTQNDNLRNEYISLFRDVPKSIPFARIALQRDPDAINFWLGNSKSTTALHKDPYENIYVQILGSKHFVLLPPIEAPCINEGLFPAATYQPSSDAENKLEPVLDQPSAHVPFAQWDPDQPDHNSTEFSHLSRPLRVTLNPGDMLYLPALWYHKVSQSCSSEGICCAVNYWYDMEYSGSFYPLSTFARTMGLITGGSDGLKMDRAV